LFRGRWRRRHKALVVAFASMDPVFDDTCGNLINLHQD
jgi:hypothetical protein